MTRHDYWLAITCLILGSFSLALLVALFMAQRGANETELRILQDGVECVAQQQNEHRLNVYAEQRLNAEVHGEAFAAPAPAPLPGLESVFAGACGRFLDDRRQQDEETP